MCVPGHVGCQACRPLGKEPPESVYPLLYVAPHGLRDVRSHRTVWAAGSGHTALTPCRGLWVSTAVLVHDGLRRCDPRRRSRSCSILSDCPLLSPFSPPSCSPLCPGPGCCELLLTEVSCLVLWFCWHGPQPESLLPSLVHTRPPLSRGISAVALALAWLLPALAPTKVLPGVSLQVACLGTNGTGGSVQPGPGIISAG